MTRAQLDLAGRPWLPAPPTTRTAQAVLSLLLEQPGEPVDRFSTTMHERTFRLGVEQLRHLGWPVLSSSDRRGYWLSFDPADLVALEREYARRALSEFRTRRALRLTRERCEAA